MAVVRITKQLAEDILDVAKGKFSDRIRAAEASAPTGEQWGEYIYEKILGKHIPIMEQLPIEFFTLKNKLTVARISNQPVNLQFTLAASKRWPVSIPSDAPAEKGVYGDHLWLNDDPVWAELKAEVDEWKLRCSTIRQQSQAFVEGVSKVLTSYSTLAPALKAWPPLWELVPEYAKDRHKQIVERTKPDRVTPEIDTTKLTAVLAASKLGGL